MKNSTPIPSAQTQQEALKMARATQRPGQTKEQTKLITQGIEKGIALYKKQQKEKHRQADKARKKALLSKQAHTDISSDMVSAHEEIIASNHDWLNSPRLPWMLLGLSWLVFFFYLYF